MLISHRLEKTIENATGATRTIARYILSNGSEIRYRSMRDIAADTGTSKATLVRFAQRMGYAGWRSFFDALRSELDRLDERQSNVDHSIPFDAHASTEQIIETIGRVRSESALETALLQSSSNVDRAAELINGARRILLFGISTNALCLALFQRKLLQLCIDAILPAQAELGFVTRTLGTGDCVIAVSYSGESEHRSPMKYIQQLKEHGVAIVALTSEGENYLREHADVTLSILGREALYAKIATFSTEASIETLLDILYARIFAFSYQKNLKLKSERSRIVEVNRQPS